MLLLSILCLLYRLAFSFYLIFINRLLNILLLNPNLFRIFFLLSLFLNFFFLRLNLLYNFLFFVLNLFNNILLWFNRLKLPIGLYNLLNHLFSLRFLLFLVHINILLLSFLLRLSLMGFRILDYFSLFNISNQSSYFSIIFGSFFTFFLFLAIIALRVDGRYWVASNTLEFVHSID